MKEFDLEERVALAGELFRSGYNCCQSVVMAYYDLFELPRETALAISSGFGGGMGRMREVCGSVSGMIMLCGMLSPADNPQDISLRTANYALVQEVAGEFREINGSIVCRQLLGLEKSSKIESPVPSDRTAEYYRKRPCEELIRISARIIGEKLRNASETASKS